MCAERLLKIVTGFIGQVKPAEILCGNLQRLIRCPSAEVKILTGLGGQHVIVARCPRVGVKSSKVGNEGTIFGLAGTGVSELGRGDPRTKLGGRLQSETALSRRQVNS